MKPSDKTAITLDVAIMPSHVSLGLWLGVQAVVWLICLAVGMAWWQWLILLLVSTATTWHYYRTRHAISHISCTHYDGVWLVGTSSESNKYLSHPSHQPINQPTNLAKKHSFNLTNLPNPSNLPNPKLSVPSKPLIYQAYLNDCHLVNLGLTQVIVLQFFTILPKKSGLTVVLFADQITADEFAKLSALARWAYR